MRFKASKLCQRAGAAQCDRARPRTSASAGRRAARAPGTLLQRLEARVAHSGNVLARSPIRSVLARGFALVRDQRPSRACRPPRRPERASGRSNSPTAASAPPRMRIGRGDVRTAKPAEACASARRSRRHPSEWGSRSIKGSLF
jgi:exodeoxyribonuclease VII large subunit